MNTKTDDRSGAVAGPVERPVRPAVADRYAKAVLNDDGTLHNFMLKLDGKSFRCECGCNVFHKPDRKHLEIYECNGCALRFETA